MKNHAALRFFLFSLVIFLLAACRDDDMIIPLSTCPEGDTYALDYRAGALDDGYIWLSESDGDVGHEARLSTSPTAGVLQVLNFPEACEETYTVSRAKIPFESITDADRVASSFRITEIAEVPNGSLLDQITNSPRPEVVIGGAQIEIWGVPPIEEAELPAQLINSFQHGYNLVEEQRYFADDSLLVLDVSGLRSAGYAGILRLRLSETQEVFGLRMDLGTSFPSVLNFSQFTPMESRTVDIDWPVFSFDGLFAIYLVDDFRNQQRTFLGATPGGSSLTVEIPSATEGVFVAKANWNRSSTTEVEVQYVYDQWPEELILDPVVGGQIDAFNYPEINLDISLADIIMLEGEIDRPSQDQFCSRQYIGPAKVGQQTIVLPDLSPVFVKLGGNLPSLYERVYTENSRFSLIHYPAMQGSFAWYLHHIHNRGFSSENWLETLQYERVTVEL
ncbi:MAG: hypothetical protein AAFO03_24045 [Bacteroidota bacterium]